MSQCVRARVCLGVGVCERMCEGVIVSFCIPKSSYIYIYIYVCVCVCVCVCVNGLLHCFS